MNDPRVRLQTMKAESFFSKYAACPISLISLVLVLASAGCGGNHESKNTLSQEVIAPKPPGFLVGPLSTLLTNAMAFSARLTIDSPASTQKTHELSGQLLGERNHLIFSPTRGDRTFIWDAHERNGFVLSEALQGFAPFASPMQVTNIATMGETAGPTSDRVNGHPGHEVEVAVSMDDGTTTRFSLWRASDLNGFPVRIKTLSADKPFVLDITDIQPARLSTNLFSPPDGFTKYSTPEIMASELMFRRAKPKKTDSSNFGEPQPIMKQSVPH
ncbi:MAG TPA: hypothetical protein VG754_00010 [Verrucomicrobiae bacterium]|nr:hypothetical protein [Verrucomicrobiae bacterium]